VHRAAEHPAIHGDGFYLAVQPALVVFDMIDNIRFGGEVANGGQRTDQLLEAMY
jgi:hypothetical protein